MRLRELVPDKQQLLQDLQANAARHFELQVRCWPAATAASPAKTLRHVMAPSCYEPCAMCPMPFSEGVCRVGLR